MSCKYFIIEEYKNSFMVWSSKCSEVEWYELQFLIYRTHNRDKSIEQ